MAGSVNVPVAMQAYPSFIVWRLVQTPGKAKPDKMPYNPLTGALADTTNPATWASYDIACTVFMAGGYDGVGFVFSDRDPFFFLDIDGARNADNWAPYAFDIVNRFAGASIEVSQSGAGLHLVGFCDKRQLGTRRNVWRDDAAGKLEFYTAGRFMAVGFGNWQAEPANDLTSTILAFVPEREFGTEDAAYTGPRASYTGPTDDDALIALMLEKGGSKAAKTFGGSKATIQQLWTADPVALGEFFPDSGSAGRAFDHSAADAALLAHLAFWTGADGERMERLFSRSALGQRDKWKERPDYRARSALGAISRCQKIYDVVKTATKRAKPGPATADSVPDPFAPASGAGVVSERGPILTPEEQASFFNGCVAITQTGRIMTPLNQFLDSTRFNVEYGGKLFVLTQDGAKTTDEPWKAATRGQAFKVPVVQDTCFRPDLPPREITTDDLGRRVVNIYLPSKVVKSDGDVSPFLAHLSKLLPNPRDSAIVLAYMAAVVQYPGVKFQWCPVIQGAKGNGKTFLMSAVAYAVGQRYVHPANASELGDGGTKFNSWLYAKLFIIIEEIFVKDKYHVLEALKPLITNTIIEFQGKGQDQFSGDNRANFMMATNHKDAVPIDEDERRYAIFYTAQQEEADMIRDGFVLPGGGVTPYMPNLWDWFNGVNSHAGREPGKYAVAGFLSSYPIPPDLNPATTMHRAPRTSVWAEARARSVSPVEEVILDAIAEGIPGFRNGWISAWALDRLIEATKSKIARRTYRDIIGKMGFVPHPSLRDGRSGSPILQEDGRKPRLYILKNHPNLNSLHPAEDYMRSQGYN